LLDEGAADVFGGLSPPLAAGRGDSVAGPGMSIAERARSATFRRVFAADLLQVQQRSVEAAIFD
jgi:hypothetical protein